MKIAIRSGWLGRGQLHEYYRFDDGRSDFILALLDALGRRHEIVTSTESIRKFKRDFNLEIHLDVQPHITRAPSVIIELEDTATRPQNMLLPFLRYTSVVTWRRSRVTDRRQQVFYYNFPHHLSFSYEDAVRDLKYVMIASNRNTLLATSRSLYSHRRDIIDYFENTSRCDFHLFGSDWNVPFCEMGPIGRAAHYTRRALRKRDIYTYDATPRSWKGSILHKSDILKRSVYSFAFENISGLNGYISEKLFDCLRFGVVPIYLPASDHSTKLLNPDTYIDARSFDSASDLVRFCDSLGPKTISDIQEAQRSFLQSSAQPFSISSFVDSVLRALPV